MSVTDITNRLFEKSTPSGHLAVYETSLYGKMLTLNETVLLSEQDSFIYHEMMAHPVLFSHSRPKTVAIIGHYHGILQEVLKHIAVETVYCVSNQTDIDEAISAFFPQLIKETLDPRVQLIQTPIDTWLKNHDAATFDILILNQPHTDFSAHECGHLQRVLTEDGLFVRPCDSSLLSLEVLKPFFQTLYASGFLDRQALNFPQPSYSTGWRTLVMATKSPSLRRIRERDVFNRAFLTRYYNFEIHKAALALPEYIREELELIF